MLGILRALCLAAALLWGPALAMRFQEKLKKKSSPLTEFCQEMLNVGDVQYHAFLTVGGERLHAILDTGSVELVIVSSRCTPWCGTATLFNPNHSSTYEQGELVMQHSYGSGDLWTQLAFDDVAVGPFHAHHAAFWEVLDAYMPLLLNSNIGAIVGLGPFPEHLKLLGEDTHQDEEAYAALLGEFHINRFSVCVGRDLESPAYLCWNSRQSAAKPDAFRRVELIDNSTYWSARLENVRLGNVPIGCADGGCVAVVDSGTSLLAMPGTGAMKMQQSLAGTDCGQLSSVAELTFTLGGVTMSLPPQAFMGGADGSVIDNIETTLSNGSSACEPLIMSVDMQYPGVGEMWVLGLPFFRKYFTEFVQGSGSTPPALYTSIADGECQPTTQAANGTTALGARVDFSSPLRVDASKLRAPSWMHPSRPRGASFMKRHADPGARVPAT